MKKICKGIGRAKGFESCGKVSDNRQNGLCPVCLFDWMESTEAGKLYKIQIFDPRVARLLKKQQKEKEKELKESRKSISRLIQEARKPFQKFIRIRDANDPCISCNTVSAKLWHGGHYFKAELYTGLIFNEINCNKQCEKCNTFGGGNESGYRLGLIKKYGDEAVKTLEEASTFLRVHKFDRQELYNIKEKYQKLCLSLL